MKKQRILFISSEMTPYLAENFVSNLTRTTAQAMQDKGFEVRNFMPRYGLVNERRNQLHEVIRLSGMNLVVNDTDQPLIIKVASIAPTRMQVYFIDNDEFFQRKFTFNDENGKFYDDNDERMLFFGMGVLETVKKLGWTPDVIHCHGWMSSVVPLYLKTLYSGEPMFANAKVVYSVCNDGFEETMNTKLVDKLKMMGIEHESLSLYENPTFSNLTKAAITNSDAVVFTENNVTKDMSSFVKKANKTTLNLFESESYIQAQEIFYNKMLSNSNIEEKV